MDTSLLTHFKSDTIYSLNDLLEPTGLDRSALDNDLRRLEASGYLQRIPGGGCPRESCADCYGVSPCPPGWKRTEVRK